ncbi:T9SS type A sorting domain-containing protein [Psychroserpens ponticola]|uniref:T9SS type A sorting domain-containing protein n=1 Tax=Psychroserpens ponticola TaxID=2932268 RepID=A0ABY7RW67_9FLAO|nr:T9SS type A sorting domain-containing protein [Psychroserpens ponticola]WCO01376.1 T9SS type A sorting domain-containing protein [Psychroserpens ponticola]
MKNYYISLVALFISFTLNAQIIDIPDPLFKNLLVNGNCAILNNSGTYEDVDTNNDNEIQINEALAVTKLRLSWQQGFSSVEGIEYFTNLEELIFIDTTNLTSIDLTNNTSLETIKIENCPALTSFNINGLVNLDFLSCTINNLTEIDLSTNINLTEVYITDTWVNPDSISTLTNIIINPSNVIETFVLYNSLISDFDFSIMPELQTLDCRYNQFTELDISSNPLLQVVNCSNNMISNLDLSSNPLLETLYCNFNMLTSLDISNTLIKELQCSFNQLETLNLKNDVYNKEYCFSSDCYGWINYNPNLAYICVDDELFNGNSEFEQVLSYIDYFGYNCVVNSYCSFELGGEFYTINGNTKIDLDYNGCDINDTVLPHVNFEITNGSETGNFISNTSGDYSIPLGNGSHTITPILENPSYFTVTPSSLTVDFPTDASPFMQDFCITPNGTFNDLEITIIPLGVARSGFDANYKIIYKNKGNTSLSGDINFNFQDDLMNFILATPTENSQSPNTLTWTFNDLTPFEIREIELTLNLNTPMDPVPLNDGDVLSFICSINFSETDETPDDNTFELQQTVVNSYDPNDKTCLEGAFITPEMVGDYVHYMIRFENTGSAEAVNIVVKDDIDRTKYDLSSLVPITASHDYVARIKDNAVFHYVEFIFENINLPFDDANNDGYIVFKIRTLDTLVLNDTFENDAEIYFDFNFPIITNNEQTTIATLSTEDFELANNSISLYPNPTTNHLTLESKQAIKQITIYDISGRLINEVAVIGTKTELTISTEMLSTGTYFVNIKTETSEVVKKIIKE